MDNTPNYVVVGSIIQKRYYIFVYLWPPPAPPWLPLWRVRPDLLESSDSYILWFENPIFNIMRYQSTAKTWLKAWVSITTVAAFLRLLDISKAKFFFFFNASLLILQGQQLHCNQICAKVLLTKLLLGTRVIKQSCCKNREWSLYFYQ